MSILIIRIIICTIEAIGISVVFYKVWTAVVNYIFKEFDTKRDEDDTL